MEKSLTDYRLTDSFNNMRMYVMDFYVFHFYTSDFLTIECDVRICGPDNEETCSWVSGSTYKYSCRKMLFGHSLVSETGIIIIYLVRSKDKFRYFINT